MSKLEIPIRIVMVQLTYPDTKCYVLEENSKETRYEVVVKK